MEPISGGVVRATKKRRKQYEEMRKALGASPPPPSRRERAKLAKRYARIRREVLCCLPSAEEVREQARIDRKRIHGGKKIADWASPRTKKERKQARKAARHG